MLARVLAVTAVVLGLAVPGWAAETENLQLFRDVQKQVLRYPHFTIFDSVHAEVNDGVVTLVGKVTMPYKRNDLVKRVSKVNGVTKVNNRLDVLPVSQFDDELRLRIARAIYRNPNFQPYASMVNPPIHIIVERGRVTLDGVVNSEVDRMLARSIASSFLSFEVKNELKLEKEVQAELEKL